MAHWNVRAQVISLGVVDMGKNFVTYQGLKVVLSDGKRKFLGKLIMHNESNALFMEMEGDVVDLYLSGPGGGHPSLLFGIKTQNEDVYTRSSPFSVEKALWDRDFTVKCFGI